jgi:aspartate/methionine/tyrosine aminotransferase
VCEDVFCVRHYREIRRDLSPGARRLSDGRNLYPPSPALLTHLSAMMTALAGSGRFTDYETDADGRDRALVASLLDRYLGGLALSGDDVFFTQGAQEAISILCGYAAKRGLAALLPLPLYYSFEQSSLRWGMPVAGHYCNTGEILWHGCPPRRLFQAVILPNGVAGCFFPVPSAGGLPNGMDAELTVIDCVHQIGLQSGPRSLSEYTRKTIHRLGLEHAALVFTVSKDLSLPGFRAGVIVTRNRDALHYAKADRFERQYAVNPLVGHMVALYVGLLSLIEPGADPATARTPSFDVVSSAFHDAGIPFPAESVVDEVRTHLQAMNDRSRTNIGMLKREFQYIQLEDAFAPVGGFSVFPRLASPFEDNRSFSTWVHDVGVRYGLKINPACVFGGDPDTWDSLYAGESRLRINVSASPDELVASLEQLGEAVRATHNMAPDTGRALS